MEASQFCFNQYNYNLGCQLENQKTFWYAKNLRESESEVICPEKKHIWQRKLNSQLQDLTKLVYFKKPIWVLRRDLGKNDLKHKINILRKQIKHLKSFK